ncbi:putative Acyl-CoA N-acyltransferase [Vibrio nigripulchritudo MADA3029]|uniref:GNAT family N-acetyltransferase n=1 Tax=Vibrio nigripulchritudo TaxID=28173 RepID=UPI0003B224AB|nr:GNAT family N-acetyltransferase [Vibrio nigripulchritudo]CCN50465.1 putative Acyl-CoA N-acyltransferase [Vibrio nigripulchritudo MADA3020]CCN52416.1 putative Acyl-CoA N-acyltransferase [Vibrio nigripulchritudo MADA3021]CCN62243.1 putative Acyl-CoA N-acyltransferase [Vibrio nigripulchritudo MADA3029]
MDVSLMTRQDFELFWNTFQEIVRAEETYAFDPDITFEDAYSLWVENTTATFVFKENGTVLGSYYLKPNAAGPSNHICNCGYMVASSARGKGLATQMCLHSQAHAKKSGFLAMQFNSVVSTNESAVKLWEKLGFNIIGVIPDAYRHKKKGFVSSYIMHKALI